MYTTSPTLLEKVGRSDPDAWVRFHELYSPMVFHWAKGKGLQAHDCQDVVQKVLLVVVEKIPKFEYGGNRGRISFRAWLKRITLNLCIDNFRRANRVVALATDPLDREDEPQGGVVDEELARILIEQARGHFSPKIFAAFMGHGMEGYSASEVGDRLGMTANAVQQAKHRVVKFIRAQVAQCRAYEDWFDGTPDEGAARTH